MDDSDLMLNVIDRLSSIEKALKAASEKEPKKSLKKMFSIQDVADSWGLSEKTVERMVKKIAQFGHGSIKFGAKIIRFDERDLEEFKRAYSISPQSELKRATKARRIV